MLQLHVKSGGNFSLDELKFGAARHRLQMAEELKPHPDYFRKTA